MEKDENDKYSMPIANRINNTGIAVVVGFVLSIFAGWNVYLGIQKSLRDRSTFAQSQSDAKYDIERKLEKIDGLSEIVVELAEQFPDVKRKAERGDLFATQWPIGTWAGWTQLPIDDEQNSRLDALEALGVVQREYIRRHCEYHLLTDTEEHRATCANL